MIFTVTPAQAGARGYIESQNFDIHGVQSFEVLLQSTSTKRYATRFNKL